MLLEAVGIAFLVFATSAALAWCKEWVVSITRKYWGNNASKMIDWAVRIVMMVGLGQTWIDLLSGWQEHLKDLNEMFLKAAHAVSNTFFTVVEYQGGDENERRWEPVSASTAYDIQDEMSSTAKSGIHQYVYKG